ncbi:MAG: hypothetical protein Q8O97_02300 [bacterium]|nr:hypothetical protein [Candidatus Wildermuthbacteria bacterium]MDP2664769.1 hypothetical protein [bacterium]
MKNTIKKIFVMGFSVALTGLTPVFEVQNPKVPDFEPLSQLVAVQSHSLLPIASPETPKRVVSKVLVVITAYSSTVSQTDDTPFITASGTQVRDGIVATNILPMGTMIKIPDLYGDRVFVVEDRMHPRKNYQVDIWFPEYLDALNFGAKYSYIEVLGS